MEYAQTVALGLLGSVLFYAGVGLLLFVAAIIAAIIDWRKK